MSTSAGPAALRIAAVTKRFGALHALRDVSFEVEAGSAFGIVGPNGAGKTTLLNCINGIDRIDEGAVLLDGVACHGRRPHELAAAGMARTFQLAEHFTSFTALDYVMLGRARRQSRSVVAAALAWPSVRRSEKREVAAARDALDLFGIADASDVPLVELPYGTQKLTDIARAVAADPRILLIDEPTSGVGVVERTAIATALTTARGRGITLVVIDHSVSFVSELCERLLVMNHGEVLALDTPEAALALPSVREAYLGRHPDADRKQGPTVQI